MNREPPALAWLGYPMCVQFPLVCVFAYAFANAHSQRVPLAGKTGWVTVVVSAVVFVFGLLLLFITRERGGPMPDEHGSAPRRDEAGEGRR